MESKTRNEISIDLYNRFFYASVCHVCKRFGDDFCLMPCSRCKLIYYCGPEHHEQHWEQHKLLCNAVEDVLQISSAEDCGETLKKWDNNSKITFMWLVSEKLGRPLERYEKQMLQFPRECLVCQELDVQLLEDCRDCAASYCKNHIDSIEHRETCSPLALCFRLNLATLSEIDYPTTLHFSQQVSSTSTFQDMSDFINTYMQNVLTDSEAASFLQVARSQLLTRPLTLFYAMRLLEYAPERRDLIIHVVDANVLEESSLMGWNVLLDLIDVSSVIIVMIGPTLKLQSPLSRDFDGLRRKKYLLEFHPVLYEEYVRSPSFVKPDLVVGFNAYILYELDSPKETWAPAIRLIAKQNCPFVLTCYERRYLKYKADRINTILDREIDYLYSGENPFASLKPNRCLKVQKVQKVCYQNQCILVYRSLCP